MKMALCLEDSPTVLKEKFVYLVITLARKYKKIIFYFHCSHVGQISPRPYGGCVIRRSIYTAVSPLYNIYLCSSSKERFFS